MRVNVRDHLRQTFKVLKMDRMYLLVIFSSLACINPISGISNTLTTTASRYTPELHSSIPTLIGKSGLFSAFLMWLFSYKFKKDFKRPENFIITAYIISILISMLAISICYFYPLNYILFVSIAFSSLSSVTVMISMIVCAQQISKNCLEGYEGFSINFVTGINNVSVVFAQFMTDTILQTYVYRSHFSNSSIIYVFTFCIELSVISLLLAVYYHKIKMYK